MKRLFIVCGISFAGKSYLGNAIAERFGYRQVDVDDVKHRLFGPACRDDVLARGDWDEVYAEADRLIERFLSEGDTVVDASRNFRRSERRRAREIADRQAAGFVTIFIDTPVEIARQRLIDNRLHKSRRDVSDADFDAIASQFDPPGPDESPFVFNPHDNLDQICCSCGRES
jgi:predicted kinase